MEIDSSKVIANNQSLMKSIIQVWSDLAHDEDLGIRFSTILATLAAFACLILLSILLIILVVSDNDELASSLVAMTFCLMSLAIILIFIIAVRSGKRAPIRQLENSLGQVVNHRYAAELTPENKNDG